MKHKIKILHLEDLKSDAELIERELVKAGIDFQKLVVDNKSDYENAIESFVPDIVLSDNNLPSFDSTGALQILKVKRPGIPFILVTSSMPDEFAVTMLKQGASDYVLKDRLQRLPSAVLGALEKKRTEEIKDKALSELQTTHDMLLFHLENSPMGFIEWDNQLKIKSLSKQAEEIFGWTLDEFNASGRDGYTQVHEEDLAKVKRVGEQLLSGNIKRNKFQHRNYKKDGSVIWCEWFNSVMKDKDGNVTTIMSLVQDITEQKLAEENLKQSEARLKEAQAIAHLGSWQLNFKTGIALWSEEACRIYGLSTDENKQSFESWLAFIHPEDLPSVLAEVEDQIKSLRNSRLDHRIILKNGSIRHIHTESRFELDGNGVPIAIYGIALDTTERHQSHVELLRSEAMLKEAQAIAHTSSWEVDLVTNKQRWSDEFYTIYGITEKEVQPSTEAFLSFMHPEDFAHAQQKILEGFEKLHNSSFTYRFIKKDGTVRTGYTEWKFDFDNSGKPTRIYGIVTDITERKEAEELLQSKNAELIKRNMELDKFVYSVSHDLRAPLTSVLGVVNMAKEDTDDIVIHNHLGLIESCVKRLDVFIRDILDYAYNSKNEVKYEQINFKDLLQDVTRNLKFNNGARKVDVNLHVNESKIFIGDKERIGVVLNNLISNAAWYQNPSATNPMVDIKIDMTDTETNIIVKDNGIGISKEYQPRIFDMFYRASQSSVGSGLGLYIVKEIVEKLNGRIEVASEPGLGTTFNIQLPAATTVK